MKRICLAALAASIVACGASGDGGITTPIKKDTTPAAKAPDPVVFSKSKFLVLTGENVDLSRYATNPSNASLAWASSDESVATISNGVVTGKGFGVVTLSVTPSGGKPTEVKAWVSSPLTSFTNAVSGCPTQKEISFASEAVPNTDFSRDTTSVACVQSSGTIAMTQFRAMVIKLIVASAGLKIGTLPWAPTSSNLFEWLISDSQLLGMQFVPLSTPGQCCGNLMTTDGLKFGVIEISPVSTKTFSTSTSIALLSRIMHETRHIQFGAHKCLTPSSVALDDSIGEQGPFGVEVEFLTALSSSPTLTAAEQAQVNNLIAYDRQHYFCTGT